MANLLIIKAFKKFHSSLNPLLDPQTLAMYKKLGSSQALVHGFKNGKTKNIQVVKGIEDMANADKMLKEFTVKKIRALGKSEKPFYLQKVLSR